MDSHEERRWRRLLLRQRGKRGLLSVIFGRGLIILLLIFLQLFIMLFFFLRLNLRLGYFFASQAWAVVAVLMLFNRESDPSVKLTWAVLILALPIFGPLLYLYVQLDLGHRAAHRRLGEILAETGELIPRDTALEDRLKREDRALWNLGNYTRANGGYRVFANTDVRYFPSGEEMFDSLLEELERAEHFIFLEYFIIEEGEMWGRVLEILERKARAGVEVRVLYDGTCAIARLPYGYPKHIRAMGIRCKMFAPLRLAVSTHYNNRDHRKIAVVDGRVAFTGGVNLADEYINRRRIYGHWKDTAVRLEGEAVRSFTLMFLQMWHVDKQHGVEEYDHYLRYGRGVPGPGLVLPYADSPLDRERLGELVYLDLLGRAQRYIHFMTPYLVLDGEMLTALTFAAKRGVEVILLLPAIPDKQFAYALAESHFPQLMAAGVRIFLYTPGFVHAKVCVSDDCRAAVGTINLDYRSFYHHFECAAYFQDMPAVAQAEADFQETLRVSREVFPEDRKQQPLYRRLLGGLFKFLAPLM